MENFCRYCGCRLDNGVCTNPACEAANRREEYRETVRNRPISLQERRRLLEAKEAENNQTWIPVEENAHGVTQAISLIFEKDVEE